MVSHRTSYHLDVPSLPRFLVFRGIILALTLLLDFVYAPAFSQQTVPPATSSHLQPLARATPVQPPDRPEIKCSVVAWDSSSRSRKPVLTLLCPAEEVFAPLHVHIKLSWEKAEDVPTVLVRSLVPLKTLVRVRTTAEAAFVRLSILEDLNSKPREEWFSFTAALDIALVIDPPRR